VSAEGRQTIERCPYGRGERFVALPADKPLIPMRVDANVILAGTGLIIRVRVVQFEKRR